MKERRRAPRYPVQDVRGTLLLSASATIVNMSLAGMAVESSANLRVGRTYRLRLVHGDKAGPEIEGRVVWCHLEGTRRGEGGVTTPVFQAGIEFGNILSEKAHELVAFLRESAVVAPRERLTGRFTAPPGSLVALGAEVEFTVRTLSTAGLLIETEVSPDPGDIVGLRVGLDGETLAARARVAYLRDVGEADKRVVSAVGVEFVELSAANRAVLERFIDRQLAT